MEGIVGTYWLPLAYVYNTFHWLASPGQNIPLLWLGTCGDHPTAEWLSDRGAPALIGK